MSTKRNLFLLGLCFVLAASSCKKDDPLEEDNENELVTTVELHLKKQGSSNTSVFSWKDLDGPGGNDPVIQVVNLDANSRYDVELRFLDESKTPAENITEEVITEGDHHRVYLIPAPASGITISNEDQDGRGMPLGISSVLTTTNSAAGSLRVVLRHYGEGGKEANDPVTSPKASSDIDISFPISVD